MEPRALTSAMKPPTCILRGQRVSWGLHRTSPNLLASYYAGEKKRFLVEEPAHSHLGVEAFLALSTLDLCHRAAGLVSRGTQNKGCTALRTARTLLNNTVSPGFFLEPSSVVPALPLLFSTVLLFSGPTLNSRRLSQVERKWMYSHSPGTPSLAVTKLHSSGSKRSS